MISFAAMNMELKSFLEEKYLHYNTTAFIANDPIAVPHYFKQKEDIEISGFITAILAWGQRKTILNKAFELVQAMENEPYNFLFHAKEGDLLRFQHFKHRTFNGEDCIGILSGLQMIYRHYGGLEAVISSGFEKEGAFRAIEDLRNLLFSFPHLKRTEKHIAQPSKGSAAKRINMFLRWMVRKDAFGVDFGIWNSISPSQLICPLDVHSARSARMLGLLTRPETNWRAAEELTENLKAFDPIDPVKYDFALFGMGVAPINSCA